MTTLYPKIKCTIVKLICKVMMCSPLPRVNGIVTFLATSTFVCPNPFMGEWLGLGRLPQVVDFCKSINTEYLLTPFYL